MDLLSEVTKQLCPWCGEPIELNVEELGPSSERYVEDCSVCCRPWVVEIHRGPEGISVALSREGG